MNFSSTATYPGARPATGKALLNILFVPGSKGNVQIRIVEDVEMKKLFIGLLLASVLGLAIAAPTLASVPATAPPAAAADGLGAAGATAAGSNVPAVGSITIPGAP